jgi:hypothetical protein
MIELILQVMNAEDEQLVREAVGDRAGIEVAGPGTPALYERADLDALILGEHIAVEYFLARPPRMPGEVVVDMSTDSRMPVYEATISPANDPHAQLKAPASWVVVFPNLNLSGIRKDAAAKSALSGGLRTPQARAVLDRLWSVQLLNVLEIMEGHNSARTQPRIRRAAIQIDPTLMSGLLWAYDTYRERAMAGTYEP